MAYEDTTPNPVDAHVGMRIRLRRKSLRLSQDALARKINLTFQQVQKYERGANRVSASTLWAIARALQVPVIYFFNDFGNNAPSDAPAPVKALTREQAVGAFLTSPEGMELVSTFPRIPTPKHRRKILDLVRALADDIE